MKAFHDLAVYLCLVALVWHGNITEAIASKSSPRWHLQRIAQRDLLSRDQLLSGMKRFDLTMIPSSVIDIYVIDTGIRIEHEEFENNRAIFGANIQNPGVPPSDCNGHGTHVAALAVGRYSGVAANARAISVRALDCSGTGLCSDVIGALNYVLTDTRERGLKNSIAVLSVGSINPTCSPTVQITQTLWENGIILTAAAGNNNTDTCTLYPARNAGTIAVGATDKDDRIYKGNNYGDCIEVFAPGVDILSAWGKGSDSEYRIRTGTSMAAPIVAGMAALTIGADPSLTANDVRHILVSSSTKNRILTSTGSQVMAGAVNRLVYAPWARLFEEIDMDGIISLSEGNKGESQSNSIFHHEDKDWNSSAIFVALSLTLHPKTEPAMHYSTIRISSAIASAAGIRSASILVRRARGVKIVGNGSEPHQVALIFYIPMIPDLIEEYRARLIRADLDGSLSKNSRESLSFAHGSLETGLLINVTVPHRARPENEDTESEGHNNLKGRLRPVIVIALICFGAVVTLSTIIALMVLLIVPQAMVAKRRREAVIAARNGRQMVVPADV